jgi:hypothetical protein
VAAHAASSTSATGTVMAASCFMMLSSLSQP